MHPADKILWDNIIKLISFGKSEHFLSEMGLENIYDEEISEIARDVLDPKQLPHYKSDTFDIWNTYIEKVLPGAYLDKIEEKISEDRACDIEDYFFYIKPKFQLINIFEYWYFIFSDFSEKHSDSIIVNTKITETIKKYLDYIKKISEEVYSAENDDWDEYIDNLYRPDFSDEDNNNELISSYVSELINNFVFADVSFDFWLKINEYDENIQTELLNWANNYYGEESEPVIPKTETMDK